MLVEKGSLEEARQALAARFPVSWVVMGGQSKLIATEYLVRDLRKAKVKGPLVLIAYVDYDNAGWAIVSGFVAQLARYGYRVSHTGYLVRPSRFTPEEIAAYALPIPAPNNLIAGLIKAWLERGGGINGQGLGIHADHLWPIERVLKAMEEELEAAGIRLGRSPRRRAGAG